MAGIPLFLLGLASFQAAVTPQAGTTSPAAAGSPQILVVGPQQRQHDRMVCQLQEQTASRIARPSVCRRASEWESDRDATQREVQTAIDNSNSQQFANRPLEPGPSGGGVEVHQRDPISRCGLRGPC